jgi:hypothetical protein
MLAESGDVEHETTHDGQSVSSLAPHCSQNDHQRESKIQSSRFQRWKHGRRAPWVGCLRRELLRRQVAQARMRALPIVLDAPLFDLAARILERDENVFIQAFLAQARIETLDVRVLDRLARFDELQPYAMLVGPLVEHPAAQLGTVIGLNH